MTTGTTETIDGVAFAHREADGDGVRLRYVEAGEGPLVVLVHGFPDCWYTWHRQLPALVRAGFRVAAPNLRGYAPSGRPREVAAFGVRHLAADLAALVDALGADRAAVVGHDWGAAAAWGFAMAYPDRLDRLAISGMLHPAVLAHKLWSPVQHLRAPHLALFQLPVLPELALRAHDHALLRHLWRVGCVEPDAYGPALQRRTLEALGDPDRLSAALDFYRAAFRHPEGGVPTARIDRPVLMFLGEQDPVFDPADGGALARWLPHGRVLRLPGAGHWAHLDRPGAVTEALLAFLAG